LLLIVTGKNKLILKPQKSRNCVGTYRF